MQQPNIHELRSFNDLMSKVGMCLLRWSMLEQELTESIAAARERLRHDPVKVKGAFAERLDMWFRLALLLPENMEHQAKAIAVRDQTLVLKDVRNLIVHGLQGGHSAPLRGEGHVRCAVGGFDNPTGEIKEYTFSQLDDFAAGAEACGLAFKQLQSFTYRITLL